MAPHLAGYHYERYMNTTQLLVTIKWVKSFCNFLLFMWRLLDEDIFFHFQNLHKILLKYLGFLSFHISKQILNSKQGSPKFPFLTCIYKILTYRCQDCSPTRKPMVFICAWRFMTSKKFQTSPKQLQCFNSESRTSNIYHFTLSSTFNRVTCLFSPLLR